MHEVFEDRLKDEFPSQFDEEMGATSVSLPVSPNVNRELVHCQIAEHSPLMYTVPVTKINRSLFHSNTIDPSCVSYLYL